MKKLTVNEMILKTLTTKITKIPKYKEILENLGYELNNTHKWSSYNYWGINVPKSKLVLNISKCYGKKYIFVSGMTVENFNKAKLFDFVNFLKVKGERHEYSLFKFHREYKSSIFKTFENYKKELEYCDYALNQFNFEIKKAEYNLNLILNRKEYLIQEKNRILAEFEKYKKSFGKI